MLTIVKIVVTAMPIKAKKLSDIKTVCRLLVSSMGNSLRFLTDMHYENFFAHKKTVLFAHDDEHFYSAISTYLVDSSMYYSRMSSINLRSKGKNTYPA